MTRHYSASQSAPSICCSSPRFGQHVHADSTQQQCNAKWIIFSNLLQGNHEVRERFPQYSSCSKVINVLAHRLLQQKVIVIMVIRGCTKLPTKVWGKALDANVSESIFTLHLGKLFCSLQSVAAHNSLSFAGSQNS